MDFIIDTVGATNNPEGNVSFNLCSENNSITKELLQEYHESLKTSNEASKSNKKHKKSSDDHFSLFSNDIVWSKSSKRNESTEGSMSKKELETILKKSVITPDFESLHVVPPYEVSKKKLRRQRQKERSKTKGNKWFGLPATEVTPEVRRDLEVLKMRSALDPKRFYKKNDLKVLPKYFQIGKVMDSPLDHHNIRLTKKQRKRTLVDELLADAEFNKYNKRKYKEIIEEKQKTDYKAWRKARNLKKKDKNKQ